MALSVPCRSGLGSANRCELSQIVRIRVACELAICTCISRDCLFDVVFCSIWVTWEAWSGSWVGGMGNIRSHSMLLIFLLASRSIHRPGSRRDVACKLLGTSFGTWQQARAKERRKCVDGKSKLLQYLKGKETPRADGSCVDACGEGAVRWGGSLACTNLQSPAGLRLACTP